MKNLTLQTRFYEHQFDRVSRNIGSEIPKDLKIILSNFAELGTRENRFISNTGKVFSLSMFCSYKMILDFIGELKAEGFEKRIPFAVDDGGWFYCLSVDEKTYGQIYLFQMEMPYENEEEAFEFVAKSFEEFIDGLQPEEPQG